VRFYSEAVFFTRDAFAFKAFNFSIAAAVLVAEEVSKWISSHNIGGTPYVNGEEVCIRGLTEMPNVIIFVNPSHAHALIKVRKEERLEYVHLYITNSHCHNAIRQDSDTETVVYLYMWSMNNLQINKKPPEQSPEG
jgi:hypothetical protein